MKGAENGNDNSLPEKRGRGCCHAGVSNGQGGSLRGASNKPVHVRRRRVLGGQKPEPGRKDRNQRHGKRIFTLSGGKRGADLRLTPLC
jgi:hypothetical protein